MRQNINSLARNKAKFYGTTQFKYNWMLEQIPVDLWLELNDKFEEEHIHVARLFSQEFHNYENSTFEFVLQGEEE